ncbi:MAG: sulfatase-like hydrolase/transferase [Planctomycetota bacterium]
MLDLRSLRCAAALASLLAAAPSADAALARQQALSPDQQRTDLWVLMEMLEDLHPGMHRYTPADHWMDEAEALEASLTEPRAPLDLYRDLARLTGRIRCGHTVVQPPHSATRVINEQKRVLPLVVERLGERWYVTEVCALAPDVAAGTELLAIDGVSMRAIERELLGFFPADGFIETGALRMLSGDFAMYEALYRSEGRSEFRVDVRDPEGVERPLVLEAVTGNAYDSATAGRGSSAEPFRYVAAEGDDPALLDVRFFGADGFEPFLARTFTDLAERGTAALVLDLRGNGGGKDEDGALLCSYFLDEPFGYFDRIEVTASYDGVGGVVDAADGTRRVTTHRGLAQQSPSLPVFQGELFVLIDGGTFSTAADVATVLHHRGRATFLGRESGGGYDGNTSGVNTRLVLPETGIRIDVPRWMYTTANVGHDRPGRGVPVDHRVDPTWESVRDGVDLCLEKVRALRRKARPAPTGGEEEGPPNVVIVLVDDLGYGDFGADVPGLVGRGDHRTPRIAGLARDGLVLTRGYAAAPNCAPSRASLQTGRWTPRHGVLTVGSSARGKAWHRALVPIENRTTLEDGEVTLAELLGPAGYSTAHVGKWHLGDDARTQGYDVNVGGFSRGHPKSYFAPYRNPQLEDGPDGEYLTTRLTDEAIELVGSLERPFLLHLAYYTVHTPIRAPKDRVAALAARGVENPVYAAMVEAMDHEVGRLLDALDAAGIAEDTLVVFTSDNGGYGPKTNLDVLRGYKGTLDEGGVRVPWIVRWPGRVEPGIDATPVHHVDLFPTLAALAGADLPEDRSIDGVDLAPLLLKGAPPEPRPLRWHFPCYLEGRSDRFRRFRTEPGGALLEGDWKVVEFFRPSGAGGSRVELYDLASDPLEQRDLAGSQPERARAMRDRLDAWRRSVAAEVPTEAEPRFRPDDPPGDVD